MKRSKYFIFLITFSFTFHIGVAQQIDFVNYQPLKSKGILPLDFSERTNEKVSSAIEAQVKNSESLKVQNQKKDFLLRSNYMIDNLLMSGNVLFGDEVTAYVNRVADRLLVDEPELREELRFYCVKSNVTNAFATNQGMIFVTLGLIAQLENEAQLAFVLGHEINHYKEKHVINSVLDNESVYSSNKKRNKLSQDESILKLSDYSKALELESDSTGFYYIENAGYDLDEVYHSFNILQFSHLPYDEIDLDFSEFETNNVIIPEEFKLDTLIEIDFNIDEDDSKSSHPNLNKRREKITKLLDITTNNNKGVQFLVSEIEFEKTRKICRFESVRIDLKNLDFVRAYYNATFLIKKTPESKYLDNLIAKSLYGIAKLKLNNKYYKCVDEYTEYEGSISAAYHFFEELDDNAVASIAIKYLYDTKAKYNEKHIDTMLANLIKDFVEENGQDDFSFKHYYPGIMVVASSDTIPEDVVEKAPEETLEEDAEGLSKYDRLRQIKEEQKKVVISKEKSDENFYQFIFTDYTNRSELEKLFEKEVRAGGKNEEKEKEKKALWNRETGIRSESISKEKIVFIDPIFISVQHDEIQYINSEDKKFGLYDQINKIAEWTNLEAEILSPKLCTEEDVVKMNNLSICNDWIEEIVAIEHVSKKINLIPSQSEYMQEVSTAYETNNIAFTGIVDLQEKRKTGRIITHLFFPHSWPFLVEYLVLPYHDVLYYTFLFDADTGQLNVDKVYSVRGKVNSNNVKSYMYDLFANIKNEQNEE